MKALKDILKVKLQTPEIILFEVKPGSQMDLIENGFAGNERLFRITKSPRPFNNFSYTYSAFAGDELKQMGTYEWGYDGTTCATQSWTDERNKIIAVAKLYGFTFK